MPHINGDCLEIILNELRFDSSTLHSCILVNRLWCRITIPILWKKFFYFYYCNKTEPNSRNKFYDIIIYLLPKSSKQLLFDKNILKSPYNHHNNNDDSLPPLFNYINYFTQISPNFIDNVIQKLINKDFKSIKFQDQVQEKDNYEKDNYYYNFNNNNNDNNYNKNFILEQEIYKLFINNCNNIKFFQWETIQPLTRFLGISKCFSQLRFLSIDLELVNSLSLFEMSQICQNIEYLGLRNCNQDIPGLINFIDIQKNLQSLNFYLYNTGSIKNQCIQLSEVIERKAITLKKFTIVSDITLLSPKILPSLINLESLEIDGRAMNKENIELHIKEWRKYLSLANFPNLQYLKTDWPFFKEHLLIEKSNGNILEIRIYRNHDPIYTNQLINSISRFCPRIERLTICVEIENFDGIKEIFLNCNQLKKIYLLTKNEGKFNCDDLLKILLDYSSKNFYEFCFDDNWIFTVEALENFFENWRCRNPLIFKKYGYKRLYFKDDHEFIVRKYYNEGVIKETNCLIYL
ncbi:unnamed protein product [Rhizophagus irregularis]|uniref:F-box domain-containing protein n=1 Tax=Rhizophagus irregularis TaxID=588596 RepID=A0A2N1N0J3_9GLOM|nr:hypothetical protein RhiirC2_852172 [Rhizophagus irregularis]CAB4382497.1 unnamed protein product [Rhizophagus irregularis]